jgi:hypothetical protein
VYVADFENDRVEKFSSTGSYLSQFGLFGTGNGQFEGPDGVAVDPSDGSVYVADSSNDRVEKFGVYAAPSCGLNSLSAGEGIAVASALSCNPSPGIHPFYTVLTSPLHGTLSGVDRYTGAFTYTPAAGYVGSDSFAFLASDPGGQSSDESVSITVNPPPSCQSASATTHAGAPVSVQLSCTDAGGATLSYAINANPAHGSLGQINQSTAQVTYTPNPGYSGPDSFTYHASSANGTATVQPVSLTVNPPPSCQNATVTTTGGVTVRVQLRCKDSTGAPVRYAIATRPAHGTLGQINQNTGQVTYTPAPDYGGGDAFTYDATSANGTASLQLVSISVKLIQINSSLTWSLPPFNTYATVSDLVGQDVPLGVRVEVSCHGTGCPHARTFLATAPPPRCKPHKPHKPCKPQKPPESVNINLQPVFHRDHLKYGSKITVRMVHLDWVGKIWIITVETRPRAEIACLAPGGTKPGQGCS